MPENAREVSHAEFKAKQNQDQFRKASDAIIKEMNRIDSIFPSWDAMPKIVKDILSNMEDELVALSDYFQAQLEETWK